MEGGQAATSGARFVSGRQAAPQETDRLVKRPPAHIICPICACIAGLDIASSICFNLAAICASRAARQWAVRAAGCREVGRPSGPPRGWKECATVDVQGCPKRCNPCIPTTAINPTTPDCLTSGFDCTCSMAALSCAARSSSAALTGGSRWAATERRALRLGALLGVCRTAAAGLTAVQAAVQNMGVGRRAWRFPAVACRCPVAQAVLQEASAGPDWLVGPASRALHGGSSQCHP